MCDDVLDGEPELAKQVLERRRGAELAARDDAAVEADELTPPERRARFDGDACADGVGQNLLLVFGRLPLEELPARHADDAGLDALARELLVGAHAEPDLRAGAHQDDLGVAAFRVGDDVSALPEARSRPELLAVD